MEAHKRALVVSEGRSRAALAGVRALGRAGWEVGVGAPSRGLEDASRWARRWHEVPLPEVDLDGFLEAVAAAVRDRGYEVVFGAGDAEVLALSFGRERLGAEVGYADHAVVRRAMDKLGLAAAAEPAGLASPATVAATEEGLRAVEGPVVVKARLHWEPGVAGAPPRHAATVALGREEARRRADEIRSGGGDPILQEPVAGSLFSVTVVADRASKVVAEMHQVASLTWPSGAGGGVRARSVAIDPELSSKVARFLRGLGWFGLAQVQFILPGDGVPRLIDLNGRFYGSMALAVAAGPNVPDLWARLATGRPVPHAVPLARPGLRYQWLEGDLRRALRERRGGLLHDVATCLAHGPGSIHSMMDPRDLGPAANQMRHLARLGFRKVGRTIRSMPPASGPAGQQGPQDGQVLRGEPPGQDQIGGRVGPEPHPHLHQRA